MSLRNHCSPARLVAATAIACLLLSAGGLVSAQQDAAKKKEARQAAKEAAKTAKAKAKAAAQARAEVTFPPQLPGGKQVVTDRSDEFLKAPETLRADVAVAKTAPTVDFLYYPGQTYPGNPWSNWGDSLAIGGKYYSAIGDHKSTADRGASPGNTGTAKVYEYDPATKTIRELVDLAEFLNMPDGHYTPGKIHGRLDMGSDGWLYFSTHRGSPRASADEYHYQGDWIFRTNPATGKSEIVVHGPVGKHCIPNTVLDPERMIFYGGTAPGSAAQEEGIRFFAYDVKNKKLLYNGPNGPARYMILARSTGRVYYVAGNQDGPLMRFDPATGKPPVEIPGSHIGVRAATEETPDGFVYTVSIGQRSDDADVWQFNTKTEEIRKIGTAAAASQAYVASVDADPTGRYLYYVPGAHGGSQRDGSAVIQFDTRTGRKKVIAFLHPFYQERYGATLVGTYATAVDPEGDKLYITWNVNRGSRAWETCGMTVIHIPESERTP